MTQSFTLLFPSVPTQRGERIGWRASRRETERGFAAGLSLALMREQDCQPAGAIDFIVDGGGQSNRGGAGDFLKPFADRLLEAGGTGSVGCPQGCHAGYDADDQQREE